MRQLPYTQRHVVISRDGTAIAGYVGTWSNPELVVFSTDGAELGRIQRYGDAPLALGDGGAWIAMVSPRWIEKWDLTTRAQIATGQGADTASDEAGLYFDGTHLFASHSRWRSDDLAHERLDWPIIPRPGHDGSRACGERFVVRLSDSLLVLYDRVRERSVFHRTMHGRDIAAVTAGGRFVLSPFLDGETPINMRLFVIDLVENEIVGQLLLPIGLSGTVRISASSDGRHAVVWSHVGDTTAVLVELDWDHDEAGDRDPLTTKWADCERPPIVDAFAPKLARGEPYYDNYRSIVNNHPALEVAAARHLSAADAMVLTRHALEDPAIAAEPAAWRQLAEAAITVGDLAVAADAAAEGLGRGSDDEGLLGVLERVKAIELVPAATVARTWHAHEGGVTAIAIASGRVISGGDDRRLRVWDAATGDRLFSYDCGGVVRCLAVQGDLIAVGTDHGRVAALSLSRFELVAKVKQTASKRWYTGGLAGLDAAPAKHLPITAIAFADDEIVTVGEDGVIRWYSKELERLARVFHADDLWDQATGIRGWESGVMVLLASRLSPHDREGPLAFTHERAPRDITALATNSGVLVAGTRAGRVHAGELLLEGHTTAITSVAVGAVIAAVAEDGTARWWRAAAPLAVAKHDPIACVSVAEDVVVTGSTAGTIVVWC